MITKVNTKYTLTPDELSFLEKLVKECIPFLTQHLLFLGDPILNASSKMEYIETTNELKTLSNLKEKFQLRKLQKISEIEFHSLSKLVENKLEAIELESKKLSFEAAFAERIEQLKINKLLDKYIDEEIKLKIIQSKLLP